MDVKNLVKAVLMSPKPVTAVVSGSDWHHTAKILCQQRSKLPKPLHSLSRCSHGAVCGYREETKDLSEHTTATFYAVYEIMKAYFDI